MTLEEIKKKRLELKEKIRSLEDEDNKLYLEQRELEKKEFVDLGSYCRIGNDLMYIHTQFTYNGFMELRGILFEVDDGREYISSEAYDYLYVGRIGFNISANGSIEIPVEEFMERTTGEYKDIIPLTQDEFEEGLRKFKEDFDSKCNICSWLRMFLTFRN